VGGESGAVVTTAPGGDDLGSTTQTVVDSVKPPVVAQPTLPGASFAAAADGNAVAIYWGQNETGAEPELAAICNTAQYNIVLLSFVYAFGGTNSHDPNGYPSVNLGTHCQTPLSSANPNFLQCPLLTDAIVACQRNGKKVLLSLGGAVGTYGFANDTEAQDSARLFWNLFLGGEHVARPFGTAILDGIDLDIEHGTPAGYAAFAKTLRGLMLADSRKLYYLTAAPQCPFPDPWMGPGAGTALGDALSSFDFLFVQFYNNASCETSSPQGWPTALGAWTGLRGTGGPKTFMGLPATPAAANSGYLDATNFANVAKSLKASAAVGGIMLWDTSYDGPSAGPYSLTLKTSLLHSP
jgi:chitinase